MKYIYFCIPYKRNCIVKYILRVVWVPFHRPMCFLLTPKPFELILILTRYLYKHSCHTENSCAITFRECFPNVGIQRGGGESEAKPQRKAANLPLSDEKSTGRSAFVAHRYPTDTPTLLSHHTPESTPFFSLKGSERSTGVPPLTSLTLR